MAKKPVAGLSAGMLTTEAPPPPVPSLAKQTLASDDKPINTTVKLEPALYLRLKAYCAQHRTNGQAVSVEALDAFLLSKGF